MKKMQRVRQIADQVRNGVITYAKGYNKVLAAVRSLDMYEREMCIQNFNVLCA